MPPEPTNWSRRYKQNVELLKSGSLANVALVVEHLKARDRDKGLSSGETRMLKRAQDILATELFLGLPYGWEGDDDGTAGDREPRTPEPTLGDGPVLLDLPDEQR